MRMLKLLFAHKDKDVLPKGKLAKNIEMLLASKQNQPTICSVHRPAFECLNFDDRNFDSKIVLLYITSFFGINFIRQNPWLYHC